MDRPPCRNGRPVGWEEALCVSIGRLIRVIEARADARAGLIGNRSDGYYGKTISFIMKNFCARVWCAESDRLEVIPGKRDPVNFSSLKDLAADVDLHGYYGGLRLLKATLKRFHDYCVEQDIELPEKNCRLWYDTNIPLRVGLAGSSAIVTAAFKALMEFYEVSVPKPLLPGVILEVETKELKIPAGYQDRVIQVYGGTVFMDFNRKFMGDHGHGRFIEIDSSKLPPLYVAYDDGLSEGTEVFHSDIRARWERGDKEIVSAMEKFAQFAEDAKQAIEEGDHPALGKLMDANFDLRASLYRLSERNHLLVQTGRRHGCSSKFAGSGGAVVGILPDESVFPELQKSYEEMGAKAVRPILDISEE
ncbi:MAG: GHMP kinase [Candidatus Omnitrophica bacterium]|nr:GHMP kinase [Candidatus Omnitrophota bacterium]